MLEITPTEEPHGFEDIRGLRNIMLTYGRVSWIGPSCIAGEEVDHCSRTIDCAALPSAALTTLPRSKRHSWSSLCGGLPFQAPGQAASAALHLRGPRGDGTRSGWYGHVLWHGRLRTWSIAKFRRADTLFKNETFLLVAWNGKDKGWDLEMRLHSRFRGCHTGASCIVGEGKHEICDQRWNGLVGAFLLLKQPQQRQCGPI